MKYQTFNNSCFFAALANLLLDFNIDVEDYDLVKAGNLAYIFRYDEEDNSYYSGYTLQGKKWRNNYLKAYGVVFKEVTFISDDPILDKKNAIEYLKTRKDKCIISLKVLGNSRWHAVIFEGIKDSKYYFKNMRKKDSNAKKYFIFDRDELINKLADRIYIGWLDPGITSCHFDLINEIGISICTLKNYITDITDFCCKETTQSERMLARDTLFRALFIQYYSMLEIIEENDIVECLNTTRKQYMKTFELDDKLILKNYIDFCGLLNQIEKIILLMKRKMELELQQKNNMVYVK